MVQKLVSGDIWVNWIENRWTSITTVTRNKMVSERYCLFWITYWFRLGNQVQYLQSIVPLGLVLFCGYVRLILAHGSYTINRRNQCMYRAFSRDVTAAILVFQNKETAAILVYQTSPTVIELYFYAKIGFCFIKPIWLLIMWVNTLYIWVVKIQVLSFVGITDIREGRWDKKT